MLAFLNGIFQNLIFAYTLCFLCMALLVYLYFKRTKPSLAKKQKGEAFDTRFVFDDNFFGLLFFDQNQECVYYNQQAYELLHFAFQKKQFDFDQFMTIYGDHNGMRSAFLLGTEKFSAKIHYDIKDLFIEFRRFKKGDKLFTSFITYDITEKEKREEQLRQFVANVSHELKTPLTTIKTYSESLLDWGLAEKTKEKIGSDISRIHEDALRMERLVSDLSLLTSLDSQGVDPLLVELELPPLLRAVIDRCKFEATKKDIEIHLQILGEMPRVFAEASSIERILTNLINNAIKYTNKNGYISIFANYLNDEIYVKVSDNGIGIAEENLPRIFDRFFRVDKTGSVLYGGTGLGLAIAKDLTKLHGGRLEVKSQFGVGTDFFFFLPTARKVYKDTLQAFAQLNPLSALLYQQAAEELLEKCKEFLPHRTTLMGIPEEEIEVLCPPLLVKKKAEKEERIKESE